MQYNSLIPPVPQSLLKSFIPSVPEIGLKIGVQNSNLKERILNFNLSKFTGDADNTNNSFLSTRTIISLDNQEIENFFTKKNPELIVETNTKNKNLSCESTKLQKFIDYSKCSMIIGALKKLNISNMFKSFLSLIPKVLQEDFPVDEKLLEFIFSFENIILINSLFPKNSELEAISNFLEKKQDYKLTENDLTEEWLLIAAKFPSLKILFEALTKIIELECEMDEMKNFLDDLTCCFYSIMSNENLRIFLKTILEIHNFLRTKRGESKIEQFNFVDISLLINKKIEGNNLFDFIFKVYKSNSTSSNLKELQIFNGNSMRILEKISKSEILGFDFNGFENMKKFYDTNLQNLLIYVNKNKSLLNHINKNYLRQVEFKLTNQIASDIECYRRSLENLGKYFLFKVKKENIFYSEIKKAIGIVYEIAQKIKSKVFGLIEKSLKEKKLEEILNKNNNINNSNNSRSETIHEKYLINLKGKAKHDKTKPTNEKRDAINNSFYTISVTNQKSNKRSNLNNSISVSQEEQEVFDFKNDIASNEIISNYPQTIENQISQKDNRTVNNSIQINCKKENNSKTNCINIDFPDIKKTNTELNSKSHKEEQINKQKDEKLSFNSVAKNGCDFDKENFNTLNIKTSAFDKNNNQKNRIKIKTNPLNQSIKTKYKI